MNKKPSRFYEFGPYRLDKIDRLLMRNGLPVPLTPKAFETLLKLVESDGRVVEKDKLMRAVWPDTYVEESNLTQYIFMLRRLLSDRSNSPHYIETIPRRGYRFVANVTAIEDEIPAPVGLMLSAMSVSAWQKQHPGEKEKTIAVLPFRIIGPKAEDEYLGVGMADALITKLSNLRPLSVRPTSAVCKYLGGTQDPISVGQELQVDAVIEGSIQKTGKKLRVTVQLVSLPEGLLLWAEKFDESSTDIFTLEDSISEQIMSALLLKFTHEEKLYPARRQNAKRAALPPRRG